MFRDRKDAGGKLAEALLDYKDDADLVLAIPRGGVRIGIEVARELEIDFSMIISRKLPFPDNPESGFGAVAEDGSLYLIPRAERILSTDVVDSTIQKQKSVIQKRIRVLRKGRPLPEIEGKSVIVTDDGIAMGSTMMASIALCRNQQAGRIIVAVPVAGPRTVDHIRTKADDLIVLESPAFFQAVAQVYERWTDVTDEEVLDMLESYKKVG
ncbi:MAG: phosphoribosyltransferase family protein [bacterium]